MHISDNGTAFDHMILKNGSIDLITSLDISLVEYITGCTKDITYVDGSQLPIRLPAFQSTFFEVPNKGLKNGSLILNISIKNIEKDEWDNLPEKDKLEMIRILDVLIKRI